MYQCQECGIIWTRHRNHRLARSHRAWDEKNERWYWALNIPKVFCPDCRRRGKR